MTWKADWAWIDTFWTDVITLSSDRVWQLTVLNDADLWLRDAYAWGRLREHLLPRGDRFRCEYVRAWAAEPEIHFQKMKGRDLIFLGRTKASESSRFFVYAHKLSETEARFHDASDGRLGNSLSYARGKLLFTRHDLEGPPGEHRRVDVDHAVIAYRKADVGFEIRRLLGISGLSTLGTLCATLVLIDDERRTELMRQVREVAPWDDTFEPEKSFEFCLRVEVNSEDRLANFLNDPSFDFRVEVVATAGAELRVRQERLELILRRGDGRKRPSVSLRGAGEVPLTSTRFRLLEVLLERGGKASKIDLCQDLHLLTAEQARLGASLPRGARTEEARLVQRKVGVLARMVHDLNISLRKLPGIGHERLIRMKKGSYELSDITAVVRS